MSWLVIFNNTGGVVILNSMHVVGEGHDVSCLKIITLLAKVFELVLKMLKEYNAVHMYHTSF